MTDPLNEDLSNIPTTMPLVNPDNYQLKIEKAEVTKAKSGAAMLKLEHSTVGPAKAMGTGETLGPGVRVFDQIMLEPTGKATIDMVKRSVASLLQAVPGIPIKSIAALRNTPAVLNGKLIKAKVEYEAAGKSADGTKSYPAKNVIGMYIKA